MRTNTPANALQRDVQNVVNDAQELLQTVQDEGSAKISEIGDKVQSHIKTAKQTLGQVQQSVQDGAKLAVSNTDAYVRSNPWRVRDCAQSHIAAIMVDGRSVIVPANAM